MGCLSSFVQILRCLTEHAISESRYASITGYSQALLSKHKTWCNDDLHWWIFPQQMSGTLRDEDKLTKTKRKSASARGDARVARKCTQVLIQFIHRLSTLGKMYFRPLFKLTCFLYSRLLVRVARNTSRHRYLKCDLVASNDVPNLRPSDIIV